MTKKKVTRTTKKKAVKKAVKKVAKKTVKKKNSKKRLTEQEKDQLTKKEYGIFSTWTDNQIKNYFKIENGRVFSPAFAFDKFKRATKDLRIINKRICKGDLTNYPSWKYTSIYNMKELIEKAIRDYYALEHRAYTLLNN